MKILALFLPVFFISCAIVTTPVKIVGKAVTTTMDVNGKVVGSGIDMVTPGGDEEESEESE